MSWTVAPAARAVLDQANARAPKRNRASDGTIGDPAHSARESFHNPDHRGVVLAVDLTHDPDGGIDAHGMVRAAVARRDPRVHEAISNGQIWTRKRAAEGWRHYGGSNAHRLHAHLSIAREHENDTSPWWPTPKPTVQEDDMQQPPLYVITEATAANPATVWEVRTWDGTRKHVAATILEILPEDDRARIRTVKANVLAPYKVVTS